MKKLIEPAVWFAVIAVLAVLNLVEGIRHNALAAALPMSAAELYRALARSQVKLQIVDARADLVEGYEDAHIPGAIPFPACDSARTPGAAREQLLPSAPTVLITDGGAEVPACAGFFAHARRLSGGMEAWSDASYPEDTGEYSPPRTAAGGGCL